MSAPRRSAGALLVGLAAFSAVAAWTVRELDFHAGPVALLCFGAVVAAAMLISWGAEAAQFSVSQGLAVAFIALLQVVPEFMVEAVIAWQAGRDGRLDLVFANATGSNRLLTGFGWPLIFFVTDVFHRRQRGRPLEALYLRPEHAVEVVALLAASSWYLVLLGRGELSLLDSAVLGGGFALYLWVLLRLPAEEEEEKEELLAPSRLLVDLPRWPRRGALLFLFALGGTVMWAVAHPFLDAMKEVAVVVGVSQFAFVQWVAPFLTEFPEKVTAVYWSQTVRLAPMALLNMVSSTVNQYTALVAMIPIAYAISVGRPVAIPMDPLHRIEIFLSFATTLYGVACLVKLRFTKADALFMVGVFAFQFFYAGPVPIPGLGAVHAHVLAAGLYVAGAVVQLVAHRDEIHLLKALRATVAGMG